MSLKTPKERADKITTTIYNNRKNLGYPNLDLLAFGESLFVVKMSFPNPADPYDIRITVKDPPEGRKENNIITITVYGEAPISKLQSVMMSINRTG